MASLAVTAGDTIEIQAYGSNGDSQGSVGGDVQLTSFTGVPEPTSLTLMGSGVAALGFIRRRRPA